jgi:hypothetical protein
MRLKTVPIKIKPQEGDIKEEKHFAWWPKRVEDKLIWLESYKAVLKFVIRDRVHDFRQYGIMKVKGGGWDVVTEKLINKLV